MSNNRIEGITIALGGDASGLSKSLETVNKSLGKTQSELKEVEKGLKLDPSNVTLLKQKQELLNDAIEESAEKLDSLRQADKILQSKLKAGDIAAEQYRSFQRELVSTENNYERLSNEAKQCQKRLEDVDERPVEEVADAAKEAARELDGAEKEAADFGDVLKADLIADGIEAIASGIADVVEETKEYRKIMASLEVSSKQAGYTAEQTAESYKYLYGILADDQTTATTTANLQALGLSQRELKTVVDGTVGAWAKYGDSIPIDGLAESINETIRAGQVTGTFADVLNWGSKEGETFGVMLKANTKANEEWNKAVEDCATAEDYFNLALQECETQTERTNLVLQLFRDQGLITLGQAWRKNNEDLVAANEAQADFTDTMAHLAENVQPAVNAVQEGFNGLLGTAVALTDQVNFEEVADQIGDIFDSTAGLFDYLIANGETVSGVLFTIGVALAALKLGSIVNTLATAPTLIAGITKLLPTIGTGLSVLAPVFTTVGTIAKGAWAIIAAHPFVAIIAAAALFGDEIQAILQTVDDFMQNVFAADWSEVFGPVMGEAMNGFRDNLKTLWDDGMRILNGVIDFIRGVFTADWGRAWQGVYETFAGIFNGVLDLAESIIDTVWGLISDAWSGLKNLWNGSSGYTPTQSPSAINSGGNGQKSRGLLEDLPLMATGGILNYGSAIVGEAGPELLTILGSGKAQVTPLTSNSNSVTNVGGNITVNVYASAQDGTSAYEYGKIIGEQVAREIRSRGGTY